MLGSLPRLGSHESGASQVAADGRSGDLVSVVVLQVPGDGVGAGVEPRGDQLLAELEDVGDHSRLEGAW